MKKHGFTLIELLAVIVIIGIVALIATPIILGVIETARIGSAKSSTFGYVHAIETKVAMGELENIKYEDRDDYVYDEIKVDVRGKEPTGGMFSLKAGTVESGVFCINGYEINYRDNEVEENGKCTGEELKLPGGVKLSKEIGYYTYPENKKIEILENISGGILSCETSDSEVATCEIEVIEEKTYLSVTAGEKEGTSTITVISEGNSKYKEARAAYVATTAKGVLSVTASDYVGVYDGQPHGITVESSNAVIKYGTTEGVYDLEYSPKYTEVGEYTVYYEVTRAGFTAVTGQRTVTITRTEGKIELENNEGTVEYDKMIEVEILDKKIEGDIEVVVANQDVVEANIVEDKLVIKGKQIGKTTITLQVGETKNYNSTSVEYTIEVTKAENKIELSSYVGQYTYPNGGTFEIISNPSGGRLDCDSNEPEIAECTMNGTTVTVILKVPGTATLTITSEETENYKAGQTAFVATTEEGVLSVSAYDYTGVYDGQPHGITVVASDATIKYGVEDGIYDLTENPMYIDAGEYVVYYEVSKEGFTPTTGQRTVTIKKAEGDVEAPTAKTLTYTGEVQELINAGSSTTGTIEYKLEDGSYSENIPTAMNPGEYTVYYRVVGDKNHEDVEEKSIKVTISKATLKYTSGGYTGVYDKEAHGIIVESLNATIKYREEEGPYNLTESPKYTNVGEYTVYYEITREGYNTVTGSEKVIITKAENKIELSSYVGQYTYPDGGKFEITSNPSGGRLDCESDNLEVAECTITGNEVTVIIKETTGTATLTITSEETNNYKAGQVAFVATTEKGLLSITVHPYDEVYDGQPHGIVVESSGATIMYGEEAGTYNLTESPTLTNVGTKTVYYQVEKAGYETVTGETTITIRKAEGSVEAPTAKTLIYTGTAQNLINAGSSITGTIQYRLDNENYGTMIPTATNAGEYKVYYRVVGDENHTDVAEKSLTVTIEKAAGSVEAPTAKTLEYTGNKQYLINAGSSETGTIQYKLENGSYSENIPTGTNPGTYVIYYRVVGDSNHNDVAEKTIITTINKASNNIQLSSYVGQYTYPNGGKFEITSNPSKGKLDCDSDNLEVAECTITGNEVTVIIKETTGTATLTITSEETDYYKAGQVAFVATTEKGLLSVSAYEYNGVYDGQPHGITVEASGATIKYGEEKYHYPLTSSPTLTDVGTKTVYYQVEKAGYETVTGERTITITKAEGSVEAPTAKTLTYTKEAQELINAGSSETGTVHYRLGTTGIYSTAIPTAIDAGTYTVYYKSVGDKNHNDTIEDSISITIDKATNVIRLSSQAASYTYPDGGKFTIEKNPSGGELDCYSEKPEIAECLMNGNEVTVTIKSTTGTANIIITSKETDNYNAGRAVFVATTEKGLLSISAYDYTGVYDGQPHGITVESSGSTIKYRTTNSGDYTLTENPTFTEVGEYTVYYQITQEGYNTVTGSRIVKITKAAGSFTTTPTAKTLIYTGAAQALVNAGSSNTGTVQYKLSGGSYATTIPTSIDAGTYTVYYKVVGDSNHNDVAENSFTVTIKQAAGSVKAPTSKTLTYTGTAQSLVEPASSTTGTVQYKLSGGTYSTSIPKATEPGTYVVYYRVVGDKNHTDVAEATVTSIIDKVTNTLTLSSNTDTYTYPTAKEITVSGNQGGALSCNSSDTSVATCSVSGNKITVTPGTTAGDATLTITSAETDYYKSATVSHVVITKLGTLSVTANGYSKEWDGQPHGITVTSTTKGVTIKYGTTEGTYNLSSSPTFTDIGEYTVYYQVTKEGYTPVKGNKTVKITTISASSISYTNSKVSSITNVEEALDYLNEKLR